jgi:1-acyl-sn-glycerol-3-phosphate acyltransferase
MWYHRYEVEGIENLDGPGAGLIAGYHGRPAAWDMCMLTVKVHERYGYIPHAIFHAALWKVKPMRWWLEGIGGVTGDDAALAEAVRRGEHIMVTPGGPMEGTRSFREKYKVAWGQRMGYVRLAIRHRIPIIPVGAAGVDDTFIALNNGYETSRRVGIDPNVPLWVGIGPLGLAPISPPWPVKMRSVVGKPIPDTADPRLDPGDNEAVARIHAKVVAAVQDSIDRACRKRHT